MNIGDFNLKDIEKDIESNSLVKRAISNFINELSNALNNNEDKIKGEKMKETREFRKY